MKYNILLAFIFIPFLLFSFDKKPENYEFALYDTLSLSMDVYQPESKTENTACVVYVFGGGFFAGSKSHDNNVQFCKSMADSGFVVAAIDYRLGMKGI